MIHKLLTVSVAAYNMEKYLSNALESLTDEKVVDDLEVFIIDDGSTDQTLEIAKKYADRYPSTFFPVHKENGGYGTTVNYSIAHATGKYFKLLDGDDWFDRQGLRTLVQTLRNIDADIIVTPFYQYWEGKEEELVEIQMSGGFSFSIRELSGLPHWLGMWSLCYKTKVLQNCAIELPGHSLYTDAIYAIEPFASMKTIFYLDAPLYHYRLGRPGQSVSRKNRTAHIEERINMDRRVCNFFEDQKRRHNENLAVLLSQISFYHMVTVKYLLLCPICRQSWRLIKKVDKEIQIQSEDVYEDAVNYGRTGRLLRMMRKTFYLLYWLLLLVPGGFPDRNGS